MKSRRLALLLSALAGFTGVDRLYLGKRVTARLKLITLGGFGLWWLWDIMMLAAGCVRDGRGRPLA